jgi:alanine-synthesizing transaminase
MQGSDFATRLDQARASGLPLLDLTEADPERCGLAWDPHELESILAAPHAPATGSTPAGLLEARDAVASYLAGQEASIAPDRVFFARSRSEAHRVLLEATCEHGREVLVPVPGRPFLDAAATTPALRLRPYELRFDGAWRLDRRSVEKAVGASTAAIVVGNPADPMGALLSRGELAFLEELCSERGLALISDESALDTAVAPSSSVARVARCLGAHVSGLAGVCGLPRLECEWIAVTGPDASAGPALSRLRAAGAALPASRVLLALPALLARRERFLSALRARLARNRAHVAEAALREAPWTLQWGAGGWWAVLQINPVQDEDVLCEALLADGVAISPGHLDGFPREGFLAVSLLPPPVVFDAALDALEARLRLEL